MVEVGGEIYTHGTKGGDPWLVGIEQPTAEQGVVQLVIPLENAALATSGDYRNYKMQDGVRLSHTIDPRTLHPIAHNMASISIIAPTVMEADAWATALNVMGEEEALRLAEAHDLGSIYVIKRGGRLVSLQKQCRVCRTFTRTVRVIMEIATVLLAVGGFVAIAGIGRGRFARGSPLKGSCGGKGGPECVCDAFEQKKCAARKRMLEANYNGENNMRITPVLSLLLIGCSGTKLEQDPLVR